MTTHGSATQRFETPHATETTRTATIINALKRRAEAVLNNDALDAQSRAVIRYALETNDPWLAKIVRRADANESIATLDFTQTPAIEDDDVGEQKIEILAGIICRAGDEPATKSAALLVLMATIENATHPKELANAAKHFAFNCCGELNVGGMVDAQVALIEGELLASDSLVR